MTFFNNKNKKDILNQETLLHDKDIYIDASGDYNDNELQGESSTNFFKHYDKSQNIPDKRIVNENAVKKAGFSKKVIGPIKKHWYFLFFLFTFLLTVSIILSVLFSLSTTRIKEISKSKENCDNALAILEIEEISTDFNTCYGFNQKPIEKEYWSKVFSYGDIINKNNKSISVNGEILKYNLVELENLKNNLQSEKDRFNLTGLVLDENSFPEISNGQPLETKIKQSRNQLKSINDKNLSIKIEIENIENIILQKNQIYGKDIDLKSYQDYVLDLKKIQINDKFGKFNEIKLKYKEFTSNIERSLDALKQKTSNEIVTNLILKEYKTFSGEEFKQLYNEITYKYVTETIKNIELFDDNFADLEVEKIAITRGYKKRNPAVETRLVPVENGQSEILQPEAKEAFERLNTAAAKDGISLVLVSGYRSVLEQKNIFLNRFAAQYTSPQIKQGLAGKAIDDLLQTTSAPGYSRHHTGYTFDLGCGSREITLFVNTPCYTWISKDNYLNAKKFGLIPSYPAGAVNQGPEPEPWEYVWIGGEKLTSFVK